MNNMREEIRTTMLANGSPMRPCEVAAMLPQYDARCVSTAIISGMYGEGILSRLVRPDGFVGYYASRNVRIKSYASEEERQAAKRANDAKRNPIVRETRKAARAAANLREKYNARRKEEAKQRAIANAAAKEAAKLERAQQRIAARAQKAAERTEAQQAEKRALWAKRKAQQRAKKSMSSAQYAYTQTPAVSAPRKCVTLPPQPAKVRTESVAEFLARGGAIQRIPAGWDREQIAA